METFSKDTLSKLAYLTVGLMTSNKNNISELVDEWIEKGKMTSDDGKKFVDDMLDKSKEFKDEMEEKFKNFSEEMFNSIHLATTEQIDKLDKRISALEKKKK